MRVSKLVTRVVPLATVGVAGVLGWRRVGRPALAARRLDVDAPNQGATGEAPKQAQGGRG